MKTYDTQGGGGACESLEDAERREGTEVVMEKKRRRSREQNRVASV